MNKRSTNQTYTNTLEDKCPECGSPIVEEKHDFRGEQLAVAICTKCKFKDWTLPKKFLENDADNALFEESESK